MAGYVFKGKNVFMKHDITERPTKEYYYAHTHSKYELLYLVRGDTSHIVEDRRYKLRPGDLILVRPFRYHYINIDTPISYERYDILFDPAELGIDNVDLFPDDTDIVHIPEGSVANEIIRRTDYYVERLSDAAVDDVAPSLLKELFYAISTLDGGRGEFSVISPNSRAMRMRSPTSARFSVSR